MFKRLCVPVTFWLLLTAVAAPAAVKRIRLKSGKVVVGDVIERTKDGIKVQQKIAVVSYKLEDI